MTDLERYRPWGRAVAGRFGEVWHCESTGSTNADGRLHLQTVGTPAAFLTDFQDAGRGRLDRRWDAPVGANILLSMAFVPTLPLHRYGTYATALGVAAADAVQDERVGLKWPNDLVTQDGEKLGGMLSESSNRGLVLGIGINVEWPTVGGDGPSGATSLARLAADTMAIDDDTDIAATDDVIVAILERFGTWCDRLETDRSREAADELHYRYVRRCFTVGASVRVDLTAGDSLVGTAVHVTSDGQLVVDVPGEGGQTTRHQVSVGDVHHLRPA